MKTLVSISLLTLALALGAVGQTTDAPDFLISAGVSFDYATKQPSVLTGVAPKIGNIAGIPTYSYSTFETANLKFLKTGIAASSQSVTAKTGILQIPFRGKHWGVFVLTDGGVVKFDLATLSTFTGGGGVYFDLIGIATKDKHHGWVAPMFREISITGMQIKPNYGVQVITTFGRKE